MLQHLDILSARWERNERIEGKDGRTVEFIIFIILVIAFFYIIPVIWVAPVFTSIVLCCPLWRRGGMFWSRHEDVTVAVRGVVGLSPRGLLLLLLLLLHTLAESVLVRIVLVGISVTHYEHPSRKHEVMTI